VLAPVFSLPPARAVDARLVTGAAVFGVGWGLAGLCPGPAVVLLATGRPAVFAFVAAMLAAMAVEPVLERGVAMRRTVEPDAGGRAAPARR
jgi:uncharacterized membrane protein YedE/YeeE